MSPRKRLVVLVLIMAGIVVAMGVMALDLSTDLGIVFPTREIKLEQSLEIGLAALDQVETLGVSVSEARLHFRDVIEELERVAA
jgi:hypothetical protein